MGSFGIQPKLNSARLVRVIVVKAIAKHIKQMDSDVQNPHFGGFIIMKQIHLRWATYFVGDLIRKYTTLIQF